MTFIQRRIQYMDDLRNYYRRRSLHDAEYAQKCYKNEINFIHQYQQYDALSLAEDNLTVIETVLQEKHNAKN